MAKKEKGGAAGTNTPDGAKILSYVEAVENLHTDLDKERSDYMNACKTIRTDIGQVFKDAKKESGLDKKALKTIIEERALKAKLESVASDLEGESSDAYAAYSAALDKIAA